MAATTLRTAHIACQVRDSDQQASLIAKEEPGLVLSGGRWWPGWSIINAEALAGIEALHGQSDEFLSEVIAYAMNEGSVLEGEVDLDDEGKKVLVWKAEIQGGDDVDS